MQWPGVGSIGPITERPEIFFCPSTVPGAVTQVRVNGIFIIRAVKIHQRIHDAGIPGARPRVQSSLKVPYSQELGLGYIGRRGISLVVGGKYRCCTEYLWIILYAYPVSRPPGRQAVGYNMEGIHLIVRDHVIEDLL